MDIHIQIGKQKRVAIVFSCPGRHEEDAGYPAAKTTGKNLNALLSTLSDALSRSDLIRTNITITNAWPIVEYEEKTGRSEATEQEVVAPSNIKRLQQELDDITEFVILCGEMAKAISKKLHLEKNPQFIYVKHWGTRGLMSIVADLDGKPIVAAEAQIFAGSKVSKRKIQSENTEKRLAIVARSIIKELKLGGQTAYLPTR